MLLKRGISVSPAMLGILAEADSTGWVTGSRGPMEALERRGLVGTLGSVQWSATVRYARLTELGMEAAVLAKELVTPGAR